MKFIHNVKIVVTLSREEKDIVQTYSFEIPSQETAFSIESIEMLISRLEHGKESLEFITKLRHWRNALQDEIKRVSTDPEFYQCGPAKITMNLGRYPSVEKVEYPQPEKIPNRLELYKAALVDYEYCRDNYENEVLEYFCTSAGFCRYFRIKHRIPDNQRGDLEGMPELYAQRKPGHWPYHYRFTGKGSIEGITDRIQALKNAIALCQTNAQ